MPHETIENITRALGRIEGKLESIDGRFAELAEANKIQNEKIAELKMWQENAKGKLWGISFVVSAAWALFIGIFKK